MRTLRTHTADIIGIANKLGAIKRREDIDAREIEKWIHQYREKWIFENFKQDKALYYTVPQSLVQDLGCRQLTTVDQSECATLPTGSIVSKCVIPAPIEIQGSMDFVGLINKRYAFIHLKSPNELEGKLAAPFGDKFVYTWRIGTSLYAATNDSEYFKDLCYLNIRMIAANPTEVCYLQSIDSDSTQCYDRDNTLYPATGQMMADITMWIMTREFNIAMAFYRDFSNNNKDDRQIVQGQNR